MCGARLRIPHRHSRQNLLRLPRKVGQAGCRDNYIRLPLLRGDPKTGVTESDALSLVRCCLRVARSAFAIVNSSKTKGRCAKRMMASSGRSRLRGQAAPGAASPSVAHQQQLTSTPARAPPVTSVAGRLPTGVSAFPRRVRLLSSCMPYEICGFCATDPFRAN